MFKKVLIANRGEIACRIIRTLRCMGIKAVAVYSEVDEDSLHVKLADEAYFIGPASPLESYLNIQAILKATRKSGADAIHPGYGFLSENAEFAKAAIKTGTVFIGPSPQAIASMGDKLEAKKLARLAEVPCIPGSDNPLKDLKTAEKLAKDIGFPLMIKAVAGGGGKGMRIVKDASHLHESLKGAIHEAESSFGDGRIFLEKYIDSSRHIEIQILADNYGNVIHLGERECSLQRRHQKVIEEAPSPFVSPSLRQKMGEEAIRLAKSVQYSSAGTIEFVVDKSENFYFLEMNTRLQVEHPVTEMITGIDLVEEMIHIAAGEPLRIRQSDVHLTGHAVEARIYAEDASRGFLPSTGRIGTYLPPVEKKGEIRLESGIREGDTLTPYYDAMIAKLIIHQSKRESACDELLKALNHFYVRGIETNICFLSSLINSSFFRKGKFDTTSLDKLYGKGFILEKFPNSKVAVGIAAVMYVLRNRLKTTKCVVLMGEEAHTVYVNRKGDNYKIKVEKEILTVETKWKPGDVLFEGLLNGQSITVQVDAKGISDNLSWNGFSMLTRVVQPHIAAFTMHMPLKQKFDSLHVIVAPMPGLVVDVVVTEGEVIKAGQPIAIIEAMKMENIIRATVEGAIEKIYVGKGDSVNLDQPLVKIG